MDSSAPGSRKKAESAARKQHFPAWGGKAEAGTAMAQPNVSTSRTEADFRRLPPSGQSKWIF